VAKTGRLNEPRRALHAGAMTMSQTIETTSLLRPGPLAKERVVRVLESARKTLQWQPTHFGGFVRSDQPLAGGEVWTMADYFATNGELICEGRQIMLGIMPDRRGRRTPVGSVVCSWRARGHITQAMKAKHLKFTAELATILRSPYVYAALPEAKEQRIRRVVLMDPRTRKPSGKKNTVKLQKLKVRSVRHGLAAIFWRNLFGLELCAMFGRRLRTLPASVAWEVAEGYWLVQPYADPSDALTEEGKAREMEIIEHLGRECFFDDASGRSPARMPKFVEEIDPMPEV
jgi:hypothetical protein